MSKEVDIKDLATEIAAGLTEYDQNVADEINMPKKSTFEKMQEISDLDEEEVDGKEVYKTMLSLMAEILSNNKNGERITAEYLESEEYDIEEIVAYINDYGDFVNSIKNNPN